MSPGKPYSRRTLLRLGAVTLAGGAGCVGRNETTTSTPGPLIDTPAAAVGETPTDVEEAPLFVEDDCDVNDEAEFDGDDPLTVGFDSRRRLGCQGLLFDDFRNLDDWGTYDGTITAGTPRVVGGHAAQLSAATEDQRAWVYRQFDDGIDLSEYDLSLGVHSGQGSTRVEQVRLQLLAPDRHNRVDMWQPINGVRGWTRLDFGPTEEFGSPDLTDVREVRFQTWVGEDTSGVCTIDELRVTPKLDEGGVILTFDDIALSQYEKAFPIMQEYGYPGVAGAIPWLSEDADRIDVERLTEMQEAGWEIVSHPQAPHPLPSYSTAEQEELLRETKQWLVDNGFESGSRFIIFPYGKADETTLDLSAKYHHLGFLGGRGASGLITGPMTVSRVNGDDLATTDHILQMAKKYRQIAVVMFHTLDGGGSRLTTPEFRKTIERIDELGLRVLTASDLWAMQPVVSE